MHFKLVYGNHGEHPIHTIDLLLLIKYSLESLGHVVDLEKLMTPGKTNILVEFFSYDFLEVYKDFHQTPNTEFIIVASEILTGSTFNKFRTFEEESSDHYDNERYWKKRFTTFSKAIQLARAIWVLSDTQTKAYRQTFSETPAFYLPHGYVDQLEMVQHKPDEYKDIDVLFTGSKTAYRREVIDKIRALGLRAVFSPPNLRFPVREDTVARAKLAVNIRQNSEWPYPSNSRFHYHITNSSLLLSETCEESCDLSRYVSFCDSSDLPLECLNIIKTNNYQQKAAGILERFKAEMPMRPLMEALLDATYGAARKA